MFKKYRTGELLNYLGVSRDTLRYYEEKGLLSPKKNSENNYRNYDILDVFTIMIIDFYRKRGMTIQQIQSLLKDCDISDMQRLLDTKKHELEKLIYQQQCILKKIEETKRFSENVEEYFDTFTIKPMPLYKVNGEVSDFIEVEEFQNVLSEMNSTTDDMLSQIMRYISFDENGVTGTKMLIVSSAETKVEGSDYHEHHQCIYTIADEIQPKEEQTDIMGRLHKAAFEYAKEHGLKLMGEAFAMIRLITYQAKKSRAYMEIFIPFE